MATATKTALQIMTVVVERVKNTSEAFSVYTGYTDDTGWQALTYKQFTGPVRRGQRWCVAGQWVQDPKWGRQFAAQFATPAAPTCVAELETLLTGDLIEGWDWRGYRNLVAALGETGALDAVLHHPDRLADVAGITEPMIANLQSTLARAAGMATIYAELAELGVTGRMADRLVAYYGAATLDRLREDPYKDIISIDGYGWKSADSLANRLGILANDPRRLRAGLAVALHDDTWQSGSTWQTFDQTTAGAIRLLGCGWDDAHMQIGAAINEGHITAREDRLYPAPLDRSEERIAGHVAARLAGMTPFPKGMVFPLSADFGLSHEQQEAVRLALCNRVMVLTGGPGVGKTTTLRALVNTARTVGLEPVCMAPTGKAAARMTEATGYPATSIHSRLKITPGEVDAGDDAELLTGMVIVDEVSMLDTQLAAALLSRIAPGAHLLLVGDPDQLPSVGPGAVLRDLIATADIPRVHLDKVYRNEAGIAVNAARIRAGDQIMPMADVQIWDADSPAHAAQLALDLIQSLLRDDYSREDILVLCPTNDGPSGRYALNALLQPLLNGAAPGSGIVKGAGMVKAEDSGLVKRSEEIRVGDRIMVQKNSKTLGVFNGQTGTVTSVSIPRSITAIVDGNDVTFSGEDKALVTLAYAITGHKSQGSEGRIVIAPIFPSRVLSREWLYTVLTRARERCYLIGDETAIQACLAIQRAQERRTGLVERIRSYSNGA